MARWLYLCLALVLALGLGSCSSGSSSGGGGSAGDVVTTGTGSGTTGTGTTTGVTSAGDSTNVIVTNTTFSEKDLTGTWNYTMNNQNGNMSCSGTMTFSGTRLTEYSSSCCPNGSHQVRTPEFWIWSDGYVKGRNYAWCTDLQEYQKFSMNFDKNSNKKRITGLMDLHLDPSYARFDVTLTR